MPTGWMMGSMAVVWILALVVLVLGAAALIKYLFLRRTRRTSSAGLALGPLLKFVLLDASRDAPAPDLTIAVGCC